MNYFISKKGRFWTMLVVMILTLLSGVLAFSVKTNYDMTAYLPQDSNTKQGIEILENTFGNHTSIELVVDGFSVNEVVNLKEAIAQIDHVYGVVWLDDYVDLSVVPLDFVPDDVKAPFYVDGKSKLMIEFDLDSYDTRLDDVIKAIQDLSTEHLYMRGEVLNNLESHRVASKQLFLIMAIIVPLCIIIMVFASKSYMEAVLILVTLGIAIVLNLGTNLILGSVSFITMTMAMALQLAMSLDYTLFLLHRYHEYKDLSVIDRVKMAVKKSFVSITVSSLTTIFGFIALCFMSYGIGLDMGLVLAKGILLSYLSTIIILPVLLILCHRWIEKTTHRTWMPSFNRLGGWLYRTRYYWMGLFMVVALGSYFVQKEADYLYQNTGHATSTIASDQAFIETHFGSFNPLVILIQGEDVEREVGLVSELLQNEHVLSVNALVTTVDPNIPRALIPDTVKGAFIQNGYIRIVLNTDISKESAEFYALNTFIKSKTESFFEDAYYVGVIPATSDIKGLILSDTALVLWLSIGLVALVIGVAFKSILIPLILVLIIEASIWFNIAINVWLSTEILYVGYLIILSIQLGATIDYAVLLTSRYLEERKSLSGKDAYQKAIEKSLPSILISALILSFAGFTEAIVSDMDAIQDIGIMLGRGTIFSWLFSVGFVLPFISIIVEIRQKKPRN